MKLDYDLIEKHGINYIDPTCNLIKYYKVDGDTVTYYSNTCGVMVESCNSDEWCEDFLIPVSKKEGDFNYKLASYEKASQAIADFESGDKDFWIFARDSRFYKLSTASAICKYWAKGKLYIREKQNWAEMVVNELGWSDISATKHDEIKLEAVNFLNVEDATAFAKAILKADGEL